MLFILLKNGTRAFGVWFGVLMDMKHQYCLAAGQDRYFRFTQWGISVSLPTSNHELILLNPDSEAGRGLELISSIQVEHFSM
jgi:hypothetical protein